MHGSRRTGNLEREHLPIATRDPERGGGRDAAEASQTTRSPISRHLSHEIRKPMTHSWLHGERRQGGDAAAAGRCARR